MIIFTTVPIDQLSLRERLIERVLGCTRMGAYHKGEFIYRYWDWSVGRG